MKKIVTISILLGLFSSILLAQYSGYPKENKKQLPETMKFGLGFEFHMFPSLFLDQEFSGESFVYVPIEYKGFLIEPALGIYNSEIEIDYDGTSENYSSTVTSRSLVIGLFKLFKREKLRFYAGTRIGQSITIIEETNNDDEESKQDIFSPTFGVEYFISNNFSFGGEAMYKMITSENEEDGYGYMYFPDYTQTIKVSTLIPKFIVRFYF